jgi:hypothetical protein
MDALLACNMRPAPMLFCDRADTLAVRKVLTRLAICLVAVAVLADAIHATEIVTVTGTHLAAR